MNGVLRLQVQPDPEVADDAPGPSTLSLTCSVSTCVPTISPEE